MCSTDSISIPGDGHSLSDWEMALDRAEEAMRRLSGQCHLQKTGHPDFFCSDLPTHWRSNKSLPTPFIVLAFCPIPDGTRVCVSAGNDENYCADVKNNIAEFNGQMARFSDLRFVGKSGRGKNFNLSITIFTQPHSQMVIVPNALKVTVDGPRDSRNASKYSNGQYIPIPKRIRSSTAAGGGGAGLEQLVMSIGRKHANAAAGGRLRGSSGNINKVNHHLPTTSAPTNGNFITRPALFSSTSANGFPPLAASIPPSALPMAAALQGLFPRLLNGQLDNKLLANPLQFAMNFRPSFLNMAAQFPRMPCGTTILPTSAEQIEASSLLFGPPLDGRTSSSSSNAAAVHSLPFMGQIQPIRPTFFPQMSSQSAAHQPPIASAHPFGDNLLAAAAAAAATAISLSPSSAGAGLFHSTTRIPNPNAAAGILAATAMANLFAQNAMMRGGGGGEVAEKHNENAGRRREEEANIWQRQRVEKEEDEKKDERKNKDGLAAESDEDGTVERERTQSSSRASNEGNGNEEANGCCNHLGSRKRSTCFNEGEKEGGNDRKRSKQEEEDHLQNGDDGEQSADGPNVMSMTDPANIEEDGKADDLSKDDQRNLALMLLKKKHEEEEREEEESLLGKHPLMSKSTTIILPPPSSHSVPHPSHASSLWRPFHA